MAQTKLQGTGTILKTDFATPGTFETVGCVINLTPPGIEYERSDALQCLDDTGPPLTAPGDELPDEIDWVTLWDPKSPENERIITSILAAETKTWHIEYGGMATVQTQVFNGYLIKFKPQNFSKRDWMLAECTIVRTNNWTWL